MLSSMLSEAFGISEIEEYECIIGRRFGTESDFLSESGCFIRIGGFCAEKICAHFHHGTGGESDEHSSDALSVVFGQYEQSAKHSACWQEIREFSIECGECNDLTIECGSEYDFISIRL